MPSVPNVHVRTRPHTHAHRRLGATAPKWIDIVYKIIGHRLPWRKVPRTVVNVDCAGMAIVRLDTSIPLAYRADVQSG